MSDLVEPVESRDKHHAATEGRKSDDCQPLLAASHLNLYRENTFRITGLSIDASEREIQKQARKLKMLEELGQAEGASVHAYSIKPAPTADQIRGAMQRLKEPEHRLIDEFFWFWPKEIGKSDQDSAIQALHRGDATAAHELWTNEAADPKSGAVAIHNLAVLYHLVALDWTLEDLKSTVDPEREAKIEQYWRKAFEYWEQVASHDDIWDALKSRVQAIDDARLTTGFVRRMRASLPEAFDKINAEAALQFAEGGRMDWARKHVIFMNETHQGLDDVEKTALLVLTPTRKRVKQLIESAKEEVNRDPTHGLAAADKLVSSCRPLLELFDLFHGKESHHKTELFDEVAETVTSCCISYGNATNKLSESNEVLRKALIFATAINLRERMQKNLDIAEGNIRNAVLQPVYNELKTIQDSKDTPSIRLKKLQAQVLPFIAQFMEKEGASDDRLPELLNSTAIVLRGISVDAYNNASDVPTALAAIQLAVCLAQDPEQKKQAGQDLLLVQEAAGFAKCFFCHDRDAHQPATISVNMFGNVQRNFLTSMIEYQHTAVKIPRCRECGRVQGFLDATAVLSTLAGAFMAVYLAQYFQQGALVFLLVGALGSVAALIYKHLLFGSRRNSYPRIKELLGKGWQYGTQPSRS